jgi:hypothetical protein
MSQRGPSQETRKPILSHRGGPPGAEVTVVMTGLTADQSVRVGFGSLSQYSGLGGSVAGPEGMMVANLVIPSWAELDRVHYFVLNLGNQRPRIISDPFYVTDADGIAHIYGTVNDQGIGCLAIDGPENVLYTLQGDHRKWTAGQRVRVVGTIADVEACGGQGLPIAVREIAASL